MGDGCGEVWGRCREVCGGMGRVEKSGVGVEKCVGVWVRGDVGKCVGVWGRCRKLLGEVWGSVCWRCGEVCWGVGGDVRKCWGRCGGVGKCVRGVWGCVEKYWGRCGENIREVWESVLGRGGGKGEMWGEV